MANRRHLWLLIAAIVILGGSLVLYKALLLTGTTVVGVGSSAIAIVVIAHLAAIAAVLAPFAIVRRRSRGQNM